VEAEGSLKTLEGISGGSGVYAGAAAQRWTARLAKEKRWQRRYGSEKDHYSRFTRLRAVTLETLLKMSGLWARGRRNARSPRLREHSFVFPDLPPALDGFTILHLTDPHFRKDDRPFLDAVTNLTAGLEVDICVLTGDYRFGYYGPEEFILPQLGEVLRGIRSRSGFYAVFGNHDISTILPGMRELGVAVLVNSGMAVQTGDAALWIGGTDDPFRYDAAHVAAALDDAPEEAFRLLLVHAPGPVREAARLGADLYLCGHTHAGQVRLPLLGAPFTNRNCGKRFLKGAWQCGGMRGYTSAGLGTTDVPVRFNCPPEALLYTLRRGPD
jgi:uncharacterized protein